MMDCPPFVHPDSTGFEPILQDMGDVTFFQKLQEELGENGEKAPVRVRPQRANEPDSSYLNRMIRYNEKAQNREELKAKWSRILFGKEKEGN
jgi:hypothetical protein